jgi:hypothetical protein
MAAKIITSTIFGLLLPWLYFFISDTYAMNLYKDGVLINLAVQKSEVEAFLEFYGWKQSLLFYLKYFLVYFAVTYAICTINNVTAKRLKAKG